MFHVKPIQTRKKFHVEHQAASQKVSCETSLYKKVSRGTKKAGKIQLKSV